MALLNESAIDMAWLCGPAPELRLLRDWVFAGELERVRSLLEPLAVGLSPPEQCAVAAIMGKQQLLERILVNADENRLGSHRILLDELHAKRYELQLDECELAWCLEALGDRPGLTSARQSDQRKEGRRWDVKEARMQCFERLVPFFRGNIGSDDYEYNADHLATAADDAVGGKEEPEQHSRPERYDHLTTDHIVQASVVAEAKEAHAVRAIAMNTSGSQLAIGTNALLTERHKHHPTAIYCVAFNNVTVPPPGASMTGESAGVIASGDADSCVKVLSLATNKEQTLRSHPGKTRALHFAADHLLWASCSGDRRICCWDLEHSPATASLVLDGHVGEIQALAFPPTASGSPATTLLSAALDKTVRLWDTRSGKCERIVARTAQPAFSMQFDPSDSRFFASGHQDGSVSVWDLRGNNRALDTLGHHQDECRAVSWSPDGAWLLSGSFDGTICVMQVDRRSKRLSPLASYHQHQDKVLQAHWHPMRPAIVTTGADKLVKLWAFA
ncbi:hypothetical protein PybrP1_001460 [[Pythium] brassicae (nom. inval.)]|nr:hypothetical protein PybrP1_001460 [[Pythium] brassicae (nom. inval.)]